MIIGVGLDIEEVTRFQTIQRKRVGLINGVFSPAEQARIAALPDPARGFTAAFALKEAAFKALGQGWLESELFWTDIELTGDPTAHQPQVSLSGAARSRCEALGIDRILAVLDARGPYVVAQVWLLHEGSGPGLG